MKRPVDPDVLNVSRRTFLRGLVAGGALVVGARLLPVPEAAAEEPDAWTPDVFLAIDATGLVTIVAHRSEMGTGIRTSLPMVVADELEADWSKVRIEQAIGDAKCGSQNTDGSRSVRDFFATMRRVGASARAMLVAAAAAQWGVPAGECVARDHAVHHRASGRALAYGALVAKARTLEAPASPPLKPREVALHRQGRRPRRRLRGDRPRRRRVRHGRRRARHEMRRDRALAGAGRHGEVAGRRRRPEGQGRRALWFSSRPSRRRTPSRPWAGSR